ncbi:MAG: hypothetical protein R2838_11690 [Caldilineaceae bacterium]
MQVNVQVDWRLGDAVDAVPLRAAVMATLQAQAVTRAKSPWSSPTTQRCTS